MPLLKCRPTHGDWAACCGDTFGLLSFQPLSLIKPALLSVTSSRSLDAAAVGGSVPSASWDNSETRVLDVVAEEETEPTSLQA